MSGLSYSGAGVDTNQAARETGALAKVLAQAAALRPTGLGSSVLEHGYYASALRITDELALGICTDGVGSKILVAEKMGKLDTIGIDCIAMNVNDLICIGAEPIALVDYVGVEQLKDGMLEEVARGLLEGARQANIVIPGGETAQLPEMVRGLDLVGTAVGVAPMDRLSCGRDVAPGDIVLALRSSGIHSNGLTLARKALFEAGGFDVDSHVDELGRTVGEELLEPTRIYVREAMALFNAGVMPKALCHITGDGLLNLTRVAAEVGFVIDELPQPQPVFDLIARCGNVDSAEMFTVFNMGIGLCIVVAPGQVDRVNEIVRATGTDVHRIGRVVDGKKRVELPGYGLSGSHATFSAV